MSNVAPLELVHFRFREQAIGAGHVNVKVYAGKTPGSLGMCGGLVMRVPEWDALRCALERIVYAPVRIHLCGLAEES